MAGKATDAVAAPEVRQAKGQESMRPKKIRRMEIEEAENGGHTITHQFDNSGPGMGYHEAETHVFGKSDGAKAIKHISKHMHIRGRAAGTNPPGAAAEAGGKAESYKPAPATSEED